MKKKVSLKIYGKVQGVFFRRFVDEKASELNLFGFVRNEPDETVYTVVEGEEENLKEFVKWCEIGPKHAEVHKVDVKWEESTGQFNGFTKS